MPRAAGRHAGFLFLVRHHRDVELFHAACFSLISPVSRATRSLSRMPLARFLPGSFRFGKMPSLARRSIILKLHDNRRAASARRIRRGSLAVAGLWGGGVCSCWGGAKRKGGVVMG